MLGHRRCAELSRRVSTRDPCRSCAVGGGRTGARRGPPPRLRGAPPTGGSGERPAGAARRRDGARQAPVGGGAGCLRAGRLARRLPARDPQQRGLGVGARDGVGHGDGGASPHVRRGGVAVQARRPDHWVADRRGRARDRRGRARRAAGTGRQGRRAGPGRSHRRRDHGERVSRRSARRAAARTRCGHRDRRGGALPRSDAGPDPVGSPAGGRDRRQRGDAPDERTALARRRAPDGPAVPDAGERGPGPRDRSHRRLAAAGGAVEPGELRLPASDPRRVPLADPGGPLRGPAARAQPALCAERGAGRGHRAHGVALRGHWRRAPPARAGAARQPLHAGAVRACLRDPDGARAAAPARLARRPLRRGGHGTDDPRVVLAPLRGAGGDPGVPRGSGEGARGGARDGGSRDAQRHPVAGAHLRARARGAGGGHRHGLRARLPLPSASRAPRGASPARRAGAGGMAAGLLAGRAARRRAGGAAAGRRAERAAGRDGGGRAGRGRVLARLLRALPRPGRARARPRAHRAC